MLNVNRTRSFLLVMILTGLLLAITSINNSNIPVYANNTDENKETFKPVETETNNDLIEIINSLKNTIVGLESKVVGIENKINKIDEKKSESKDSSKISNKWSTFAKVEKESDNHLNKLGAEKTKDSESVRIENEKHDGIATKNNDNENVNSSFSKNNVEKLRHNISIQKIGNKNKEIGVLLVNNKKVLAYNSKLNNLTPFERTKIVAKRLEQVLDNKGKISNLKTTQKNGIFAGSIDNKVIFTIDSNTARNTVIGPNNLAMAWVNNIREAYSLFRIKQPGFKDYAVESKRQLAYLNNITTSRSFDRSANKNAQMVDNSPIIQILIPLFPSLNNGNGDFTNNSNSSGAYTGYASWYGPGFDGRRTSDGSRFSQFSLTAAHKTLPFGTVVKVTNLNNNKICYVRINDRGPFISGRIIDLSKGAASQIGMLGSGVAKVKVEVIGKMK